MTCFTPLKVFELLSNLKVCELLEAVENGEFSSLKENYPKSTLYYQIQRLKELGFVEKRGEGYWITQTGNVCLKMMRKLHRCVENLNALLEHFPNHIISIPEELILRLDELGKFEVVESKTTDILKPHRIVMDLILKAKNIKGVVPIFYPDYPSIFNKIIDNVETLEIVVTEDVLRAVEIYENVKDYSDRFHVYVIREHPLIAFTVTDYFFSAGFYRLSGDYDFWRVLVSKDKSAVSFGEDLFRYYRNKSVRML